MSWHPRLMSEAPRLGDRSLFPRLTAKAYLNHAAVSPLSAPVADAVERVVAEYGAGLSGAIAAMERREQFRRRLADFIGAPEGSVAFVQNTTLGVTHVALSLPWRVGDRVLLFDEEFPANVTPWQRAAELFGLDVEFVPTAPFHRSLAEGLAGLEHQLDERVRLVAVSLVQFQSGLRMPIGAIAERCRSFDAEIFVDAIQGLGVVPFDVGASDVDYLSCGGHKWLMGVEGAGFTYVRPRCAERFVPRTAGWISHEDAWRFLFEGPGHLRYDRGFKKDATLFEGGSQSALGYAALDASLDLLVQVGPAAAYDHVQRYHDAIEPELEARGFLSLRHRDPSAQSGSLCLKPPPGVDVVALGRGLRDNEISVAIPDGNLRLAPHWPNNADVEVPQILRVVDAFLANIRD